MGRAQLFNPSRSSTEELESTFVGRQALLESLEADLLSDAVGASVRHWQIVGPRGSGKSHLVELLGRRLSARDWDVVRLSEEQYQVASLSDFLERIVASLVPGDSPFRDERDPRRVVDLATDWLGERSASTDRPLLVIVENLGRFLTRKLRSKTEQRRLRGLLLTDPPFVLLATATSVSAVTTKHDAPFYDFFHNQRLEELGPDDVRELVQRRARWDGAQELLDAWSDVQPRLLAMHHFSGGNPRLVVALYRVLRDGIGQELSEQLVGLLDEITPYYQARLDDLAPQPQRLLVEMALAPGVMTPAELAARVRLSTNQVTAVLKRLEAERFVHKARRVDGRSRLVEVTDRLFRIWLQMRESPEPDAKLRFLVEFYRSWYGGRPGHIEGVANAQAEAFWRGLREADSGRCWDALTDLDYLAEAVGSEAEVLGPLLERCSESDIANLGRLGSGTAPEAASTLVRLLRWRAGLDPLTVELCEALGPYAGSLGTVYFDTLEAFFGSSAEGARRVLELLDRARWSATQSLYPIGLAAACSDGERASRYFDRAMREATALPESLAFEVGLTAMCGLGLLPASYPEFIPRLAEGLSWIEDADLRSLVDGITGAGVVRSGARAALPTRLPVHDCVLGVLLALALPRVPKNLASTLALVPSQGPSNQFERAWSAAFRHALCLAWIFSPSLSIATLLDGIEAGWPEPEPLRLAIELPGTPASGDRALTFWAALRDRGLVPEDEAPYAEAAAVAAAEDRHLALARLHPEVRPAVAWLLELDEPPLIDPLTTGTD